MSNEEDGFDVAVVSQVGDQSVLSVRGALDLGSAAAFRDSLMSLLESGQRHVVVDVSQVSFVDSTGLGVLVGALKRLRAEGGELVLVGAGRSIRRMLAITGLSKALKAVSPVDPEVPSEEAGGGERGGGEARAPGGAGR